MRWLTIILSLICSVPAIAQKYDIRGLTVGMTADQLMAALDQIPDCASKAVEGCITRPIYDVRRIRKTTCDQYP